MKKIAVLFCIVASVFSAACSCVSDNSETAKKGERKIAVQTYTMKNYTLEESIALLSKTPVRALEAWDGQKISKKYPNVKFNTKMNAEQKKFVKDMLDQNGFKLVGMGVFGARHLKTEEQITTLFEFAKYFNAPVIDIEPTRESLPMLQKCAEMYGIKLSIHNHQRGSGNDFYNPNVVMDYISTYSNIGACPDTGAWSRSGLDPVKCFKTMEGKILLVHFKDQAKFDDLKSAAMPYGKGVLDMKAMLKELDRQGYNGYFVIEHGDNSDQIMPIVEHDIKFLQEN